MAELYKLQKAVSKKIVTNTQADSALAALNHDIDCASAIDIKSREFDLFSFFFFKQKTAYEISTRLEFRRVLFRSILRAIAWLPLQVLGLWLGLWRRSWG